METTSSEPPKCPRHPLSDAIVVAVSKIVDDAQSGTRAPSHSDIEFEIKRAGLLDGDPKTQGPVGKAKRIRAVLHYAIEEKFEAGEIFVSSFISMVRGHGGFREASQNFIGKENIENLTSAFALEGYELSSDGELRPKLLEGLSGAALTDALEAYVRRAKRGSSDAALVAGTSKDLLEAVAAHILKERGGSYPTNANFSGLLGMAFVALGLATPHDPVLSGEPPNKKIERAMYDLACGVNQLRNKQGTGHGRPWLPTVTSMEATMAIELMGVISERLLNLHLGIR